MVAGVSWRVLALPVARRWAAALVAIAAVALPESAARAAGEQAPVDAAAALEKTRSAYEYGDMEMVVDEARAVAEGRVRPTPAQRAQALRYLGIGLFLTGRTEGAEMAFYDLLRLKPGVRLDPTTTRPDVVAFFENVRARHASEIMKAAENRGGKRFIWNFLPPLGQFQNGHAARGWTIAAIELLSLGAAIGTYAQLKSWENPDDHTFGDHTDDARTFRTLNYLSVGVFAATLVVGVVDGIANYRGDREVELMSFVTPGGIGFRF
jgi:hypothetical protein